MPFSSRTLCVNSFFGSCGESGPPLILRPEPLCFSHCRAVLTYDKFFGVKKSLRLRFSLVDGFSLSSSLLGEHGTPKDSTSNIYEGTISYRGIDPFTHDGILFLEIE